MLLLSPPRALSCPISPDLLSLFLSTSPRPFALTSFAIPSASRPPAISPFLPADGKVVAVVTDNPRETRVSIFLNIFDVHVNRTPISGVISEVKYQRGKFLVASRENASVENEMNTVTIQGDGTRVVFKQIAGLIARRIVFEKKAGDFVNAGERVGLIKFGSRVDVIFGPEWVIEVRAGMRVSAGTSILAHRADRAQTLRASALPVDVEEALLCRT